MYHLQPAHNKEWGFHNARVNKVAWSPNSTLVASGSLDTTIIIWSIASPAKHTIIKSKSFAKRNNIMKSVNLIFFLSTDAHPQSQITGLVWLDHETVISTGQDCNVKVWEVESF